jgi:hypothetical protein
LLSELDEDVEAFDYAELLSVDTNAAMGEKVNALAYATLLSETEQAYIAKHCRDFMKVYGYELPVQRHVTVPVSDLVGQRIISNQATRSKNSAENSKN